MANSANLALPFLAPGQANQTVVHNEALKILDAVWQLSVISQDFDSPPGSPAEGDTYIVKAPGYGAWEDQGGNIAAFIEGAWQIFESKAGWQMFDKNVGSLYIFDGSDWVTALWSASFTQLGVNTTADTNNRLAVRAPNVLFTAETDDIGFTLNKVAAGDDNRIVFQTNWSTRAIFGTLGSDDFGITVTPDGSNWFQALTIDKDTGHIGLNGFTADSNNALGIKGTNFLFDAEVDHTRFTLNKVLSTDDGGFQFQQGYNTRAFVGLFGNDDFTVKVTPNGSDYYNGLVVDVDTGRMTGVNEGVIPAMVGIILNADRTGTNALTAQNVFGTPNGITLLSDTTYEFEAEYYITRAAGTTSHTTGISFAGTATLASINYLALVSNPTGNILGTVSAIRGVAATNTVLTAANTAATENIRISLKGTIRVTTGGTFIPQFQYSAAPGGAPTINKDSFIKLRPIGDAGVGQIGDNLV
jgi:hypothetical protein